jgi:hypothetical protein
MKSLASRKQLLIAESELNRAQLVQEWRMIAQEVRSLAEEASTIGGMATAAATLVTGIASCRLKSSAPAAKKQRWAQTIVKVAGFVSTISAAFRTRRES